MTASTTSEMPMAARGTGHRLGRLLDAIDIPDFARRVAAWFEDEGFARVTVAWRMGGQDLCGHGPAALREDDFRLALDADAHDGWAVDAARGRVAAGIEVQATGDAIGIVLDGTPASGAAVRGQCALLAPVARAVFEKHRLTASMRALERSEQLQAALFRIADMASSDMDLPDMLRELHAIVARFMYAENFYIALYDEQKDAIRFIYLVDTEDALVRDPGQFMPMAELERGLTWYVIRGKHPLMGSMEDVRRQVPGPMRDIGADAYDWLGVPIMAGTTVRGVLVVQSYVERPRYTQADQALLTYVGSHILTALDRKLAQEELERRVGERTQELRLEVQERQRSVRIQEALYRIAELSHTATHLDEFYAAVHGIVGEFLDARNFYIALLSDDDGMLRFPYFVDQGGNGAASRKLGRGVTEYAMRYGRPLPLAITRPSTVARIEHLRASGELEVMGRRRVARLGVPPALGGRGTGPLDV